MDDRTGPFLLLLPIVIAVAGYLLAWRSKSSGPRKAGTAILAVMLGLVALFGSWWALGMSIGIWALDGSGYGPKSLREILQALAAEILILIFPLGAWYLSARFGKAALRKDQPEFRHT